MARRFGNPALTREEAQETVNVIHQCLADGFFLGETPSAVIEAGRRMGKSEKSIRSRLNKAAQMGITVDTTAGNIDLPEFPQEDISAEEDLERSKRDFLIRRNSHEAHKWFKVKVRDPKPIGVLWFGDPHLDDNGCNTPLLMRHAELCKTTDGLYGANIGDTTNNWSGRLVHLYANQNTSKKRAQRRAEWFMLRSGIRWLVWLIGNHDAWSDGEAVLALMAKQHKTQKIVMHDWEARFSLAFPNGWEARVNAAHNFKGHSDWNSMHGLLKAGKLGEAADLLVAGDRHNWGVFHYENASRGLTQTLVRVRGYKFDDEYARRIGAPEQQGGCSILTIFDPESHRIHTYEDVDEGVDFLTWKRSRA